MMKHLLLTTIAAVVLVGCGDLQKPVEKVAETELESFIPKSVVKLSEAEVRKVLMLFVGERVGQGEVNYLEGTQMKYELRSLLNWVKEKNTISGITELIAPNGEMILKNRVYYDKESNLFIDEQMTEVNDAGKVFGIWDAKEMTINWYRESNELRGHTKQKFTCPRQSTSTGKTWKKVGSEWELSTNSNNKIQPKHGGKTGAELRAEGK